MEGVVGAARIKYSLVQRRARQYPQRENTVLHNLKDAVSALCIRAYTAAKSVEMSMKEDDKVIAATWGEDWWYGGFQPQGYGMGAPIVLGHGRSAGGKTL